MATVFLGRRGQSSTSSLGKKPASPRHTIPASAYGEFVFSKPVLLGVLDRVSRFWNINKAPPNVPQSRLKMQI
jgi:hypothetical protein